MISRDGYRMGAKGYNDPFKIIPGMSGIGTNISMLEDDGAPLRKGPLFLEDNFGNFDIGIPGMERIDFAGDYVKETPIKSRDAYSDLLKLVSQRNEERKRLGPTAQPNLATGGSVHNKYLPKAQAGSETDSTNSQKLNTLLISRIEAKRAALAAEKEAALAAEEANKVPVVESAQPVTQPAQPVVQPVVQPVQRVVQPAPPVTPPVQPAVQPITQPVAQPVQPTAPPVQPVQSIEPVPTESVSQTAAEAAAEAAVKAVANKAAAESVEPAPNLQGVIEMENPIEGSEDFPNLLQPLDISWRGNLNKKDFELMPKGDQTNVWMDGVGMIGEHTLDGGDYRTIQQKIDDIHKQIEGLNDQIQGLTYISTDPNLGEASTQAKKEIAKIEDGQQQLIDEINQIKRNYAGNFDTWASNELSPTISKPLQKWGLIDQYSPSRLEKPVFETYEERAEKEKIAAEKTREELITTNSHDEINPSDNAWYRWQYRTSASNDDPLTVKIYGTRKERSGNSLNIKSKGSIMHFLDQSPLSGFMHNKTKVFYKNSKADDYFGYLKANEDGTHQVMYKKKKDIPADELYKNTFLVRQNDFDAINFNGRHIDRNFDGHTYWSLKGTNYKDPIDLKWKERPAIPISAGIDHNTYDYSSGQTVVYIFQYKDKTRYVHFAGSPNAIKKEGDRIKKEYDLKKNDLKIGVADAGSYSSSVKGNITNDLLNSKDYGYYNMSGNTGAGMALIEKKVGGELKKLKRGGELRKLKRRGQLPTAQDGGPKVKQRRGVRNNPDGSVSSHLMKAEYVDGRGWVAFPSLFQDSKPYADDQENWVDMSDQKNGWWSIYEEADKRGEVYDFGEDKEAALAFGMGSWKDQLPEHLQDKKHGGQLPKAQIWNSAIKGGRRLLGLGDDAVNYEKNAIINEWKLLNNAAKPISKSSSISGKTFNSADELRAAFHQKNAADLSGAKLSPSPELVSAIEANVPSSAPFFSQLDYHGARLAKDSQTITKKGSSYNYPKTVHTLAQQYEKMPTLNSAGFPVYFHGTGSASIPGILKQKGLVPYGQLKNSGLTPMTGEMSGVSLGNKSVNTDHLSTTFIENLQDPIRYAGAFSKNKRDIFGDYGNFMKNITQYTNEYGIEKATRMKEFYTTQLEDFLRLSDYEQALVKENYPVMFGFNPTKATSLGGNRFKIPSMSDIRAEGAIRGKIGWDEVAGMFVPKTKMGLTQDMVGNNIKVGNLDEIVRGTFNLNDARKYKWNQGGESSRVQFRDWFKNAYS